MLANGRIPRLVIGSGEPAAEPPVLVQDAGLKPADEPVPDAETAQGRPVALSH